MEPERQRRPEDPLICIALAASRAQAFYSSCNHADPHSRGKGSLTAYPDVNRIQLKLDIEEYGGVDLRIKSARLQEQGKRQRKISPARLGDFARAAVFVESIHLATVIYSLHRSRVPSLE